MIPALNRLYSRLLEATAVCRSDCIAHPRNRVDAHCKGETGGLFEQDLSLSPFRLHFPLRYKRLEKDRFKWPESEVEVMEIGTRELEWLLACSDIREAHGGLSYTTVV